MKVVNVKGVTIGQGMTKICAPIAAATDYDLKTQIKQIKKCSCDLVEFRADIYEDCLDQEKVIKALELVRQELPEMPLLFTFRTRSEGGNMTATEEFYKDINLLAINSGFVDLIDIEFFMGTSLLKEMLEKAHEKNIYVIVSNHDFKTTIPMEQIVARYKDMIEAGADIAKIAMMPEDGSQVVDMMQAAKELQECGNQIPLVVISMGDKGISTRTTGEMYGNTISFGTAGAASAPGQIEVDALRSQMEMIHNIVK